MKSRLFIFIATILLFSSTSWAQMKCSELFQPKQISLGYEMGMLLEFKNLQKEIRNSKDLTEANDNIHLLTILSNMFFDRIVDFIQATNSNKIPIESMSEYKKIAESFIETLQQTYRIDSETMSMALENRILIENAELKKETETQRQRRAIGFGRDQSLEKVSHEQGTTRPIGFRPIQQLNEKSPHPSPKISIGFDLRDKSKIEDSIRDIVDYNQPIDTASQPMGFVPFVQVGKDSSTQARRPIGFVRFDPEFNKITRDRLYKIVFDIERGIFELTKNSSLY